MSLQLDNGTTPTNHSVRVAVEGVSKEFIRAGGSTVRAIDDATLYVNENEIVVLLGPSGCGKSTLLRSIAGLETPSAGRITIGGTTVFDSQTGTSLPPYERDVNMMFQSYALWPHMTLEGNVAYPLRVKGVSKKKALANANEYLDLVGLGGLGGQFAGAVSGGQAQRAALARTLIAEPAVVLFDEPLSNVDAKVRSRLRGELLRIHSELGFSAVYVTHDQIEAMGVGSRIAVMRSGQLLQVGEPEAIYERPENRYVAEFIGEANLLDGKVSEGGPSHIRIRTALGDLVADQDSDHPRLAPGAEVLAMIRPEHCRIRPASETNQTHNAVSATVVSVLYAGSRSEYLCDADGNLLHVWATGHHRRLQKDAKVEVELPRQFIRLVSAS